MKLLFGPHTIRASEIFFTSKYSFGLVNLKPVVPGHVLVISRRVVDRVTNLTPDEVSDMFQSAQLISTEIEKFHKAESMTITVQDGPKAGQTVPHVHIHLIPRRTGDWLENDDIYPEIERKEKELGKELKRVDADRVAREPNEMANEAAIYRKMFKQYDNIWE
ncbi:HIT-like domain-containing protein [Globomyces pollinis-pini]|nr:HIT-like domain-containing protein [Globomyces pollinis-pini]